MNDRWNRLAGEITSGRGSVSKVLYLFFFFDLLLLFCFFLIVVFLFACIIPRQVAKIIQLLSV